MEDVPEDSASMLPLGTVGRENEWLDKWKRCIESIYLFSIFLLFHTNFKLAIVVYSTISFFSELGKLSAWQSGKEFMECMSVCVCVLLWLRQKKKDGAYDIFQGH